MKQKQFLNLCRDVSLLPDGVAGTRRGLPPKLLVEYDGAAFYPLSLEIKFIRGEPLGVAVLHSLTANSLIHAPLDKVNEYKGGV